MEYFNSTENWTANSTELTPTVTYPFPPSGYHNAHIIVWSIVVGLIIIGIVFGNSLVCISVVRVRALKGTQYRFLVSLALADLMVGILIVPLSITNELLGCWVFGTFLCLMWKVIDVLACTASILNLCLISLDRYYSITRPIKYAKWRTHRRAYFMIGAVWTLSFIISVPPLFGWRNEDKTVNGYFLCEVSSDPGYVLYSTMGSFFIPAFVMVFVYIRIWGAAKKHARTSLGQGIGDPRPSPSQAGNCGKSTAYELVDTDEASSQAAGAMLRVDKNRNNQNGGKLSPQEPPGSRRFTNNSMLSPNSASSDIRRRTSSCDYREVDRKRRKVAQARERRATVVLGIIMGSFLACWYPFFQLYVIATVCGDACNIPDFLFKFVFWIGYCNSALNPLIYTIFNRDFRKAFKKVLGIGR
ncbi:alpha-2C adrenergic receptor-like [Patiria miniata]|uniref:G-protein coupled receptors family 1 profile domain-containing protein n=1 Tax=Patiria miniata TaxID=46514 RepID=A0A914B5F3_PATMI|nr:alpha-2C adrenergic receptor-like [Patiria miniata]